MFNKINLVNLIQKSILFILILTPIFSIQASLSLIIGGIINNSTALTSPYIKGIKDLFFIFIIFVSFLLIIKNFFINRVTLTFLFVIIICILIPAYYYHRVDHTNILIFLSGIKWLMPFILAVFLIGHINEKLLYKMGTILFYLFIFNFFIQIVQLFFAGGWFGFNALGLSARNPGIFFIPSTAGVFTILVLFFSKFYMDKKLEKKIFFLITISIFLTESGTAIGAYIIFIAIYKLKKSFLPLMPIVLTFLAIALVFSLGTLSDRPGLLKESFGTRLIIFSEVLNKGTYFAKNFGYGTNTALLIKNRYGLASKINILDSWFSAVVVNLGLINGFVIAILLILFFIALTILKDKEKLIFLIMYSLFSVTTIFTESYPANLIFAVLLAYYIKPKKDNPETPNNPQQISNK